jgi:protein RecA
MASAEDLAKAIADAIGANDDESTVRTFLDTGFPPLNMAASAKWDGGLPVGRMVEIAGPPSSGKTAVATRVMAAAQKAGGIAGFMDHERSFSLVLAPKLGLDTTPGRFIFKKPRTFEESLQMCVVAATHVRKNKLIAKDAPIAWVFDSLASMVPQSALLDAKTGKDKSFEDRTMNDNTALARATSAHFPAFAQHTEELGICAIFLNQLRTNIGVVYGDPRKTTGGSAPEFYFSQRLWLSASAIKKGTETIGQEVKGSFKKNKVARPFLNASWRFMFEEDGTGRFDAERSMIDFLEENKFLKTAGPGFVDWDGKRIGKDALAAVIRDTNAFDKLKALLPKAYEPPVVAEIETEA